MLYYYNPTQVAAGEAPTNKSIRVGGLVQNNSIKREPGSLEVTFSITDFQSRRLCSPRNEKTCPAAAECIRGSESS